MFILYFLDTYLLCFVLRVPSIYKSRFIWWCRVYRAKQLSCLRKGGGMVSYAMMVIAELWGVVRWCRFQIGDGYCGFYEV